MGLVGLGYRGGYLGQWPQCNAWQRRRTGIFRGLIFIIKWRQGHGAWIRSTNVKSLWDMVMVIGYGYGTLDHGFMDNGSQHLSLLFLGFMDEGSQHREVGENDGQDTNNNTLITSNTFAAQLLSLCNGTEGGRIRFRSKG